MKKNKQKKDTNTRNQREDLELIKHKKKSTVNDTKINVRSKKFWEELYDVEGEELEKFIQ